MEVHIPGAKVKRATLEAVVIRADGTREDLGMIGYTSRNPLKNALMNFYIFIRSLKRRIKG